MTCPTPAEYQARCRAIRDHYQAQERREQNEAFIRAWERELEQNPSYPDAPDQCDAALVAPNPTEERLR